MAPATGATTNRSNSRASVRRRSTMKQMITVVALATLAIVPTASLAQEPMPSTPPLSAGQAQQVQREMDAYRRETDARVARGEITPDEAQRLLQWREWQLAQQAAGL